jgi:hypothetical protein
MKARLIFILVCVCLAAMFLGELGLDSWFDGR